MDASHLMAQRSSLRVILMPLPKSQNRKGLVDGIVAGIGAGKHESCPIGTQVASRLLSGGGIFYSLTIP